MTSNELKILIEGEERQNVEFKENSSCDACLIEDFLALCNDEYNESYLFFGVTDDGKVESSFSKENFEKILKKIKGNLSNLPLIEEFKGIFNNYTYYGIKIYDKFHVPYFYQG